MQILHFVYREDRNEDFVVLDTWNLSKDKAHIEYGYNGLSLEVYEVTLTKDASSLPTDRPLAV
jgi:hypothetical protein